MTQSRSKALAEKKKAKVIADLVKARKKILATASLLSSDQWAVVFLGVWSPQDLLAHLVGWDRTNLKAAKELLAGQLPSFYAYHDHDWQTYNARLVKKYGKSGFVELISLAAQTHQKLVDFLVKIPAEEFDQDQRVRFKGYKVTIGRLLQAETRDEQTHYTQIKELARRRQTS